MLFLSVGQNFCHIFCTFLFNWESSEKMWKTELIKFYWLYHTGLVRHGFRCYYPYCPIFQLGCQGTGTASATTQRPVSSNGKITMPSRGYCIRRYLKNKGFLVEVIQTICASWRSGTEKQYSAAWRAWCVWKCFKEQQSNSSI